MNLIKKWISQYKCGIRKTNDGYRHGHSWETEKWKTISECNGSDAYTGKLLPYKIPIHVKITCICKDCILKKVIHIYYD